MNKDIIRILLERIDCQVEHMEYMWCSEIEYLRLLSPKQDTELDNTAIKSLRRGVIVIKDAISEILAEINDTMSE
jgi:hypothetical protein